MSQVKSGARAALGAATVILGLYVLWLIRPVAVLLLVSILFAQAISPPVLGLRRIGARRAQAVLAIYLVILAALAGIGWLLWQAVSSQAVTLLDSLPDMQRQLQQQASAIPIAGLRDSALAVLSGGIGNIEPAQAVPSLVNTARALLEAIFAVFSVFVITFYWISERLTIRRWLVCILPLAHRERALTVWADVEDKLGAWVRGQLVVMLCIGAAFALGLGLLGVKFWLLLGLFAALAEIVPIAGPYIGTIPAVLVALTQSTHLAVVVTLYGVVVQLLENNVLVPRIMGHSTGISPLTVILGILIGTTLLGLPGALLAVPVAAAAQVLLTDLELLGSRDEGLPAPDARRSEPVVAR